ncbi:hypothetical protein HanRHA438_Chr06g0269361 [Helianthus annuus]|nr:hypothetical protein HanRHA438_Chr06g0269361 [Helianthus annuus]
MIQLVRGSVILVRLTLVNDDGRWWFKKMGVLCCCFVVVGSGSKWWFTEEIGFIFGGILCICECAH